MHVPDSIRKTFPTLGTPHIRLLPHAVSIHTGPRHPEETPTLVELSWTLLDALDMLPALALDERFKCDKSREGELGRRLSSSELIESTNGDTCGSEFCDVGR
jgi:hypothetical protein